MHRVVLTGSSGILGRNFIELVGRRDDFRILALVRSEPRFAARWPSIIWSKIDYMEDQDLHDVIQKFAPTCVLHCAATGMIFPRPQWFELIRFNVDVSITLCECAARAVNCQYIYIGTGLAYREQTRPLEEDDPLDSLHPYGASKAAADIVVRAAAAEFGVPLTVLRPFSFTGVGDDRTRLFGSILDAAARRETLMLSAGTQIRDHCSARDIASGILAAIEKPPAPGGSAGRVYNLGSGQIIPLRSLIERVVTELALPVDLQFGGRPLSRFEPRHLVADVSLARRELGWLPHHNLAHAVWELARDSYPDLLLQEPVEHI